MFHRSDQMRARADYGGLLLLGGMLLALAAGADSPLAIRAIAEVEVQGKLQPADRIVSGDQVLYTLEVRNTGPATVSAPSVTYPIPRPLRYVEGSAQGPGATVSYSVDGVNFAAPENLRPAEAADYTQIRWRLKHPLKPNSVAFLRFRVVVK
jgi:uncharacterized repeat protein (TIGR01451 family)